jgi:hypothetical protein
MMANRPQDLSRKSHFGHDDLEKIIEVLIFKARLVACGYAQVYGVHYMIEAISQQLISDLSYPYCISPQFVAGSDVI